MLADIVRALGPGIVEVLAAPDGLGRAVTGVVILDDADIASIDAGVIVLAVGVDVRGTGALELVEAAGRREAAAVVMRLTGTAPPVLTRTAGDASLVLLGVPQEMRWGQLYSLLRTVLADTGREGEGDDLFDLANAIAAAAGGPVTIEDPRHAVLAYSNLGEPIDQPRSPSRSSLSSTRSPVRPTWRRCVPGSMRSATARRRRALSPSTRTRCATGCNGSPL